MKLLISGGTGFIGKEVAKHFDKNKNKVTILTRKKKPKPIGNCQFINDLKSFKEDVDVIINLSGKSINKGFWTTKNKKEILSSRINTTSKIIEYIKNSKIKPKMLLSASAIGYYGHQIKTVCEDDKSIENSFLSSVCQKWESVALISKKYIDNCTILRFALVLGRGGLLKLLKIPYKYYLGAILGDGKNNISWIVLDDLVLAIEHIIKNNISGIVNISSPNPVTAQTFYNELAKTYNSKIFFKFPSRLIKLLLGSKGNELLLANQIVMPKVLIENGFIFKYQNIYQSFNYLL